MYQYQVSFGEAVSRAFKNYCCFTGRASRSEYWWFALFCVIVNFGISCVFGATFGMKSFVYQTVSWLWSVAIFLPSLGLVFRRLHDTGRSGWNWCWSFLPIVGWIILIIFMCQDSQMTDNQYGPVPNMTA